MVSYDVIMNSSMLHPKSDSWNWPRSSEWYSIVTTLALKASSVSSSTMSGGSAFQSLTVLGKKDIFLLSILELIVWNALLWLCFVLLWGGDSLPSLLMANISLSILYIMQRRASFLLSSRLHHFRLRNISLTLEVFLCLLVTYLAARHWTISNFCILVCVYGQGLFWGEILRD